MNPDICKEQQKQNRTQKEDVRMYAHSEIDPTVGLVTVRTNLLLKIIVTGICTQFRGAGSKLCLIWDFGERGQLPKNLYSIMNHDTIHTVGYFSVILS
jgi:hypothetical protein